MARHRLRKRYGRAFGDLPRAPRPMHRSRLYKGATLELWHRGTGSYEVRIYKGGWHHPWARRGGATPAAAFASAERCVDSEGKD